MQMPCQNPPVMIRDTREIECPIPCVMIENDSIFSSLTELSM